ncbi:MAG: tetratricopeptide repeat protein, partial [Candidatus Marinimicrobia bacterium]|nr:tetratricopeptide repeat protein [Candidatus Neomarinimicrobiota bacterium]
TEIQTIVDAFLVEFASAVEAARCAIAIQKMLVEHNASATAGRHILLRIGLHVGDVVIEEDDVLGDGVNIAARIEPLASPGGICLSEDVARQVDNKIDCRLEKLGEKRLKGIKQAVAVYRVVLPWEAGQAPTVPSRSIAVLPFMDMSQEQDQEYFCDGMAEELLDALSRIKDLRVSARTSSFSFKGQQQDIREIGNKLNVATVLEGSVRKAGNRLRISAQLINVADGYHLWSERYDRELKDVFAIQDEIAGNIVQALRVMLSPKEKRALGKVPTTDVEAYDVYLRGRKFFHQFSRKNIAFARQMFNRATQIDPDYALAYAGIADCHSWLYMYWESTDANLRAAEEASRKALELDTDLAEAHVAHGLAVSLSEQYDEAEREFETAIRLDPRLFEAYYFYARTCWPQGKPEKAAELFEKACEVNPEDYQGPLFLANTYNGLGRKTKAETAYRRSLEIIERHLELNPDDARAHYLGANALIQLGEGKRGLKWARRALAIDPGDALILYNVACIYALSEEIEEAIDYLEKSAKAGATHKEWIEHDSDLDLLRSHPHFQTLLAQMS